jgi:tetratricopeptide (TPR) repeat protein
VVADWSLARGSRHHPGGRSGRHPSRIPASRPSDAGCGRGHAQQLGLIDEARPLIEAAILSLEPLGAGPDLARALQDRGNVAAYGRRPDDALDAFEQALRIWREIGDPYGITLATQSIGQVHAVIRGDAEAAERWTAAAYEIARQIPDPFTRAEAASVEAESLLLLGRYPEAAGVLGDAIAGELATGASDPLTAAQVVGQAGMLAAGTGADVDAARLHGFCVDRHADLVGRPDWLAGQWEPLEYALGQRLGPGVRDALMADGAGLTTGAALELGLAHARRVEAAANGERAAALSP